MPSLARRKGGGRHSTPSQVLIGKPIERVALPELGAQTPGLGGQLVCHEASRDTQSSDSQEGNWVVGSNDKGYLDCQPKDSEVRTLKWSDGETMLDADDNPLLIEGPGSMEGWISTQPDQSGGGLWVPCQAWWT